MFVSKINSRKVIKQREYKDDIKNTSKQAQSITTKQKNKKTALINNMKEKW